jgi:DNA-binding response OmpR family regulator
LAEIGYTVTVRNTLNDALNWLHGPGNRPDLIISDTRISSRNDHQLLRMIRPDPSAVHPSVILLAANDDIADKITGFEVGADDYLVKPVNMVELGLRIRAVLARTQAWRPPLVSAPM